MLQEEAKRGRKKGAPSGRCVCGGSREHRGRQVRSVLTAAGAVKLSRVYFVCRRCRRGRHGADRRLGLVGARTRQAERMLCLAGASWSFAQASANLDELAGLKVSAGTVRSVCQREAERIEAWQANAPAAGEKYRKTPGIDEFEMDGTCINTTAGWKEMRVGVFAKRTPGEPATPSEWTTRKLPPPGARVAFAAIEDHDAFAARRPLVASRLGVRTNAPLDVWADGAKWIWERVELPLSLCARHAGRVPRPGTRRRSREGSLRRRNQRSATLAGPGARRAAGRRPRRRPARHRSDAPMGAVRGGQRARWTAWRNIFVLMRQRLNYAERPGRRPADRQRAGRRGLQKLPRPTSQANRRPLAHPQRQPHGHVRLARLRRPMVRLLGQPN